MIATVAWTVYVVFGVFAQWAMNHTEKPWLDAILIRFASAAYLAAGLIGAGGIIGKWMQDVLTTTNGAAASVGWSVVIGVVAALAVVALVLTWLPETWFSMKINDALALAGLILPSLVAGTPGPLGEFARGILAFLANFAQAPVQWLTGGIG